jgi:hypothetical protein
MSEKSGIAWTNTEVIGELEGGGMELESDGWFLEKCQDAPAKRKKALFEMESVMNEKIAAISFKETISCYT